VSRQGRGRVEEKEQRTNDTKNLSIVTEKPLQCDNEVSYPPDGSNSSH